MRFSERVETVSDCLRLFEIVWNCCAQPKDNDELVIPDYDAPSGGVRLLPLVARSLTLSLSSHGLALTFALHGFGLALALALSRSRSLCLARSLSAPRRSGPDSHDPQFRAPSEIFRQLARRFEQHQTVPDYFRPFQTASNSCRQFRAAADSFGQFQVA